MEKLLSVILAVVMTLSVFSCVSVYAVEETTAPTTENTTEGDVTEPSEDEPTTEPEPQPTYATAISEVTAKVEGVYVKWTCDGEADKYNVYRRAGGEPKPTLIATVTTLDYIDKTVKSNVYYKYHVEAVVDGETKATSEGVLTQYLKAVKITYYKLEESTQLFTFRWENIAGAKGYELYCRKAGETEYKRIGSGAYSPQYTLRTIGIGTGYHKFAVVAVNGNYRGVLDTNGPLIKCFPKIDVSHPTIVGNGIKVTWREKSEATGYRVYRRAGGEKYYTYLGTVQNTQYIDTTVECGKYYTYVVRGDYNGVYGSYDKGSVIQYITKPTLEAVANATNGVYVRWTPVPGAKYYTIYRREAGGNYHSIAMVDAANGNRYKDTTVVPLEYYRYTVLAHSSTGHHNGYDKNGLLIRYNPLGTTWSKDAVISYYNFHIDKSRDALPFYTMKAWQNVDSHKTTGSDNAFVKEFQQLMATQYIPANDPYVYEVTYAEDGTELFPRSGANSRYVKSAAITQKSNSYIVTIVMNDQVSPEKTGGGISAVSANILDYQGFVNGLYAEDLITSGTAKSTYKNFTIVATFSKDGKLIAATHSCKDVTASMDLNFVGGIGKVKYNAQFDTYLTYSDFVY